MMATGLLQLSLCVVMVIQLTSSQPTYDVVQRSNDVSRPMCGNNDQVLGQLTKAVTQLTSAVSQMQTTMAQLQQEVAELRTVIHEHNDATCQPQLVLQNTHGSNTFNRSWAEYKAGFSDAQGNYWLGNDKLHQLTAQNQYKLRIEVQSNATSQWYWAEYSNFTVLGESTNYKLLIGGFTGNTGSDAMARVNGMTFSTYDRDNDASTNVDCVNRWQVGGFWYESCYNAALTSPRPNRFFWRNLRGGERVKAARMQLLCI